MAASRDYEVAASVYPDPRTLYEKDEWYYESPLRKYRGPVIGGLFGFMVRASSNWIKDRPIRSGIHIYVLHVVGFAIAGTLVRKAGYEYFGYRDRVFRHYIATHPDDFPPPPKIKIGEKFEPWVPIR